MIAGVTHCRLLPTSVETEWALAPETLAAAVDEDLKVTLFSMKMLRCQSSPSTSSGCTDGACKHHRPKQPLKLMIAQCHLTCDHPHHKLQPTGSSTADAERMPRQSCCTVAVVRRRR